MRNIIPNILFLLQYLNSLTHDLDDFHPSNCPDCGRGGLWAHGHYERKSDRASTFDANLNPIPILRFYCHYCGHTCSVLPECIPPRRWYLWVIQQQVIEKLLSGGTAHRISQSELPSRWTIKRWMNELTLRFSEFAACLKSGFTWLGYCNNFTDFWQVCFAQLSLSRAMIFLNNQGVIIP